MGDGAVDRRRRLPRPAPRCASCCAAGARVRALSRRPETDAGAGRRWAPSRCAATSPIADSLAPAMAGVEAVFHAAADTNTWAPGQRRADRAPMSAARSACCRGARGRRVARSCTPPACRRTRTWCTAPCARTCRSAAARAGSTTSAPSSRPNGRCAPSGLPFIMFQPAHILGPGDTPQLVAADPPRRPEQAAGRAARVGRLRRRARDRRARRCAAGSAGRFGESFLLGGEHASFLDCSRSVGRRARSADAEARDAGRRCCAPMRSVVGACRCVTGRAPQITPEAAMFTCHAPAGGFVARRSPNWTTG